MLYFLKEDNFTTANLLKRAIGNSASTTLSSGVSDTDTSFPLTSDTAFTSAGMVIIDEGTANEEFAYATGKVGSALTIPLANRGLEGTSAAAHAAGASVKGVLTAAAINDLITSLANVLLETTGAVDTTKIVTPAGTQSLTNKTVISRVATYTPSGAGTTTLDLSTGNIHIVTMPAATQTLAISNGTVGECFWVKINNVTSQGALTWFSTITWRNGGITGSLTGTNGKQDSFFFYVSGSGTYDGYIISTNG